ncbi:MAG: hypothetical protein JXJ17_07765 [Anaerolineae bacterium]|nr:hypothetical protein [Anaerolineae bacterium]
MNSGNMLVVILPIMAVLLAGLSIAALYLWWRSSRDEEDEGESEMQATIADEPSLPEETLDSILDDRPSGSFFERMSDSFKPVKASAPARPVQTIPAAPIRATTQSVPVGNAVEVMRIMRDIADGSLFVEIDGRSYRKLDDITDPETGRRFMGNVQSLAQFARLGDFNVPDDWARIPEPPQIVTAPPSPPPFPGSKATRTAEIPDSKTPGMFSVKRLRGEKVEIPEPVPIADQIEEILQYRLSMNPDLMHRSIHIRPGAQGMIRIEVDGISYGSVADVPDESVREFLQSVINEWEARQ